MTTSRSLECKRSCASTLSSRCGKHRQDALFSTLHISITSRSSECKLPRSSMLSSREVRGRWSHRQDALRRLHHRRRDRRDAPQRARGERRDLLRRVRSPTVWTMLTGNQPRTLLADQDWRRVGHARDYTPWSHASLRHSSVPFQTFQPLWRTSPAPHADGARGAEAAHAGAQHCGHGPTPFEPKTAPSKHLATESYHVHFVDLKSIASYRTEPRVTAPARTQTI